jgi:hypothetical protein
LWQGEILGFRKIFIPARVKQPRNTETEQPENIKGGKKLKKIFGIALALALVLSMAVMVTPVSATITVVSVTVDNPLVGADAEYTITFTMEEPVESARNEYIDVCFPAGTGVAGITAADCAIITPATAIANVVVIGTCVRIHPAADIPAGTVTVRVGDDSGAPRVPVVNPPDQCWHTLCVGTTAETCQESPPYNLFLFKFELRAGWNLISLPCIPEDPDITVVLADLIARQETCCQPPFTFKVYYYDCTTWYAYNNGSYASLREMDECRAYWIWVSEDISFYIKCSWYPEPPEVPLKKCYHECWNMVGFTSNVDRDPFVSAVCAPWAAYMAGLAPPDTVAYILGWDNVAQVWAPVIQGTNCLVVGQGYWMSFVQDACFAVPPPGV